MGCTSSSPDGKDPLTYAKGPKTRVFDVVRTLILSPSGGKQKGQVATPDGNMSFDVQVTLLDTPFPAASAPPMNYLPAASSSSKDPPPPVPSHSMDPDVVMSPPPPPPQFNASRHAAVSAALGMVGPELDDIMSGKTGDACLDTELEGLRVMVHVERIQGSVADRTDALDAKMAELNHAHRMHMQSMSLTAAKAAAALANDTNAQVEAARARKKTAAEVADAAAAEATMGEMAMQTAFNAISASKHAAARAIEADRTQDDLLSQRTTAELQKVTADARLVLSRALVQEADAAAKQADTCFAMDRHQARKTTLEVEDEKKRVFARLEMAKAEAAAAAAPKTPLAAIKVSTTVETVWEGVEVSADWRYGREEVSDKAAKEFQTRLQRSGNTIRITRTVGCDGGCDGDCSCVDVVFDDAVDMHQVASVASDACFNTYLGEKVSVTFEGEVVHRVEVRGTHSSGTFGPGKSLGVLLADFRVKKSDAAAIQAVFA